MEEFCLNLDQALISCRSVPSVMSGSTGIISIITKEFFVVSSVGDSRCCLLRNRKEKLSIKFLNTEMIPTIQEERTRILNSGGVIHPFRRNSSII